MTEKPLAMRDAILSRIWGAMSEDEAIYFTCADFGSPVLDKIRADFPNRFINVGVAEQNLINISAGLALEGYKVFAYAIAPFITMRAFEQIRVSLALLCKVRDMNINLIGVGAGYSYVVSGPTHQCYEDLTLMRSLPTVRVLSPSDHVTAGDLFDVCIENNGPKYLRLDAQVLPVINCLDGSNERGFRILRSGGDGVLVCTGYMTHVALEVAERLALSGLEFSIVDLIDVTHCDVDKLIGMLKCFSHIVSLEEGFKGRGGLDALVLNLINENALIAKFLNIGVPGQYQFELGTRDEIHELVGIGANSTYHSIVKFINQK